MEKINQFSWRPIYIAYALAGASLITLAFAGIFERGFVELEGQIGLNTMFYNFTVYKIAFFILDTSLIAIAVSPLQNEDERVEKIRNYALKSVFLLGMLTAAIMGLVLNTGGISFLVFVALVVSYYLLLFRLSLYRDPVFVYMSDEELRVYARSSKKYNLFAILEMAVVTAIANIFGDKLHDQQLVWIIILTNVYIMALIKTVYFSFKG